MPERRRTFKVGERVQQVVARELMRLSDPRLIMVTITGVVVSSDMRNAKIYFVVSGGPERVEEVTHALEGASGSFRTALAKELKLRFTPTLRFYFDDTLDVQENVANLLAKIKHAEV